MGVSSECFSFSVFLVVCLVSWFSFVFFRLVLVVLVYDFACHSTARASSTLPLSFIPPMTMIDREALQAHAFATKPQGGGS